MTEILTFCTKKVINGAENNFSGIFFGNEFTKICAREDELFGQGYGNVLLFFVGSYTCSCLMSTTHVDRSGGGGNQYGSTNRYRPVSSTFVQSCSSEIRFARIYWPPGGLLNTDLSVNID